MNISLDTNPSPAEIGRYLSAVRERAGMKQAELARKITWSPAVLSRVESGDRPIDSEELDVILRAIGTGEAAQLAARLTRVWSALPRPALDHPDQELLWEAHELIKELVALKDRPDIRSAFEQRILEYISEIQRSAHLLLKRDHQVAFVGSIGIGKSTAICRALGLEVILDDSTSPVPVLEAGAGGITICEVHVKTGPAYGLMVEPKTDDEVRAEVSEFVDHIRGQLAGQKEVDSNGVDGQGISKEMERAIRNMAQLKIKRERGADGKLIRFDEARQIAATVGSARDFVVDVLARMQLHQRDSRSAWYESSSGKPPLHWLRDVFEAINNGRHPDFGLPNRIEVVVPQKLIDEQDLSVRIVDTRGIDRTAAREDLESLLQDPHTLTVLCSGFNNAPAAEARLLLERARQIGVRALELKAALLVLPRANEALAVKDESGIPVGSTNEGYELKAEQITLGLQPLQLADISVGFFNAFSDDAHVLRDFVRERLMRSREAFRTQIRGVLDNVRALIQNHERQQVQEVQRAAGRLLQTWVSRNRKVGPIQGQVAESLMTELERVYASTIRASVRREGEWRNLSYSHHLGWGARRIATLALTKVVDGFSELCATLIADHQYQEAQDLLRQARQVVTDSFDDILRKVQLMGQTGFKDALRTASGFWEDCDAEWGRGPGYRDRVLQRNADWFSGPSAIEIESALQVLVDREWSGVLDRVSAMLEAS